MGTVNIGNLDVSITVQIRSTNRRKPTMSSPNMRGRRLKLAVLVINCQTGTKADLGLDDHNLLISVAINIDQARDRVFEYMGLRQRDCDLLLGASSIDSHDKRPKFYGVT